MPDEPVAGVDQRLQGRIRVCSDRDVEDARGIELVLLALGDEACLVELPGVGVAHEEAILRQFASQLGCLLD